MLILCCPQSHLLVFLKNKIVFPLKWRQYSGNNIIQILDVVTQTSRAICLVWDRLESREGRSHNVNATASDYHPYFLCSISPSRVYYCITTASAKIKKGHRAYKERKQRFIRREELYLPGCVNETTRAIWEVLFFLFFQHFLQQYRRHRIHSFTNTKHTTTLVAAAASAVKRRGGGGGGKCCGFLEVAISVLAILPFQRFPSSIRRKPALRGCHMGTFSQH